MSLLQKFIPKTLVQIVGSLLILVSGILVAARIFGAAPDFELIENNWYWSPFNYWSSYFFLIGAFLYCSPKIIKKLRKQKQNSAAPLIFLCAFFLIAPTVSAQNYSKQVDALAESFKSKSIDSVKSYLSADLQFGPIPAVNSTAILTNMVTNFPLLNSLEIVESKNGEAIVKFNFVQLGENESSILFDEEGKITKIEYLEEFVLQEIRAQQRLQNSVQQPAPGELGAQYPPEKIQFDAGDGLTITGNLYEVDPSAPIILLCHSGGSNKYEYADIAPKLNAKGFNALVIDQRSGGMVYGKENETFLRAEKEGFGTEFVDAQQDIEAAIDYLVNEYGRKVTLWGSSYSAALSLYVVQQNENLNGLILFSPGDYLADVKGSLKGELTSIGVPFLITSTQDEAKGITDVLLYGATLTESQIQYVPSFEGFHGVRALWEGQVGSEEYWEEVWRTLSIIYPDK
ncbi:MAG: alpha/beta hydrolase [Balneolaceae bacterium]|nr:alpha/beta hydrolase [Balneolaceae bacterium]